MPVTCPNCQTVNDTITGSRVGGPIVYIVGVAHPIQIGFYRGGTPVHDAVIGEFAWTINSLIDEYSIVGVFEELAPGVVAERSNDAQVDSVAKRAIDTRNDDTPQLHYGMVDLTGDERARVSSILDHHSAQGAREDAWIARIAKADRWPALFICGPHHSLTFALAVLRYRSTDLRRWGCALVEHEWEPHGDLVRFIPKHPRT